MCRSMVDIQSAAAEIRRGIKKDRKKPQGKNIMPASATQGGHNNVKYHMGLSSHFESRYSLFIYRTLNFMFHCYAAVVPI